MGKHFKSITSGTTSTSHGSAASVSATRSSSRYNYIIYSVTSSVLFLGLLLLLLLLLMVGILVRFHLIHHRLWLLFLVTLLIIHVCLSLKLFLLSHFGCARIEFVQVQWKLFFVFTLTNFLLDVFGRLLMFNLHDSVSSIDLLTIQCLSLSCWWVYRGTLALLLFILLILPL